MFVAALPQLAFPSSVHRHRVGVLQTLEPDMFAVISPSLMVAPRLRSCLRTSPLRCTSPWPILAHDVIAHGPVAAFGSCTRLGWAARVAGGQLQSFFDDVTTRDRTLVKVLNGDLASFSKITVVKPLPEEVASMASTPASTATAPPTTAAQDLAAVPVADSLELLRTPANHLLDLITANGETIQHNLVGMV
ncbi:hypothetical protein BCR44DRAFT_330582 [Catenaria anguillulae PL171]|uniref:Uncharacterized protein n=1 Tax=Catenaria anguillulae PL171 TaxID=765915 RepID=A0A1Y2HL78_9FUNG|nr:hypothetical protein BCR44DRAFT_330582 [Catenaria anguillulae PL171]